MSDLFTIVFSPISQKYELLSPYPIVEKTMKLIEQQENYDCILVSFKVQLSHNSYRTFERIFHIYRSQFFINPEITTSIEEATVIKTKRKPCFPKVKPLPPCYKLFRNMKQNCYRK